MRLLWWSLAVFVAVILLIPTMLSTSLGPYLLSKAAPSVKVDSLSLNWLSDQEVIGVIYRGEEGDSLHIDKVTLKTPLWKLLVSPKDWGTLLIESPSLHLSRLIKPKDQQGNNHRPFIPPISTLEIHDGELEMGKVSLEDIFLKVTREEGFQRLPFTLQGVSHSESGDGKIQATGILSGPSHHFEPIELQVDINRFPLETVDRLLEQPLLVDAIGPFLSLSATYGEEGLAFQVESERLNGKGTPLGLEWQPAPSLIPGIDKVVLQGDLKTREWKGIASLKGPLSFLGPTLTLTGVKNRVEVAAKYLEMSPLFVSGGDKISLKQPVQGRLLQTPAPYQLLSPLTFSIQNFSIGETLNSLALAATAEGGIETPEVALTHLTLYATKEEGAPLKVEGTSSLSFKTAPASYMAGNDAKISITAEGSPVDSKGWIFNPIAFQLSSSLTTAKGTLGINEESKIETLQPIFLNYLLTPQTAAKLFPELPPLENNAKIEASLSSIAPFDWDKMETWNFRGSLNSPALRFKGLAIEAINGRLDLDGQNHAALSLNGKVEGDKTPAGKLNLNLLLNHVIANNQFSLENASHDLSLSLSNFPSAFLPQTKELFGETLSIEWTSKGTMTSAGGTTEINSSLVHGKASWGWDKGSLSLSTPHLQFSIPASFFEQMLEPIRVDVEIDQLVIPKNQPLQGRGKGLIEVSSAPLLGVNGEKIDLPAINGEWNLGADGLRLTLMAENGGFSLNALVQGTSPLPKHPTLKDFSIDLLLRGGNVPSALLFLSPELTRLQPILSPAFSADVDLKFDKGEGSLSASLTSPRGTLITEGRFHEGWFFLKRPLEISLQMTPEVAKGILGELMPLISSGIKGRSPIRISIDSKGFRLPLQPFDLNKVEIGEGIIALDQIDVYPVDEVRDILSILGINASPNRPELLWFTPLYFSLKGGVATLKRVDVLISNRFPIALWGKIDFARDRVQLEIGLAAKTLEQAFGMKGLPSNYILPLPLRGSLDSPSIDKTSATAKIGTLLAQLQGSTEGILIGGVLDLLTGGLTEQGIPPPTTQPPWETEQKQKELPESNSPLKQIFKGIEEGAKSILKKKK